MTKTLSMVSQKYNLCANEGFVIFLTSKLITYIIGGFTLKMKSQPIAYLLNGSEHIYWILDLEGEVHSTWDLWISGLQECKGNGFFDDGRVGRNFRWGPENLDFSLIFHNDFSSFVFHPRVPTFDANNFSGLQIPTWVTIKRLPV